MPRPTRDRLFTLTGFLRAGVVMLMILLEDTGQSSFATAIEMTAVGMTSTAPVSGTFTLDCCRVASCQRLQSLASFRPGGPRCRALNRVVGGGPEDV